MTRAGRAGDNRGRLRCGKDASTMSVSRSKTQQAGTARSLSVSESEPHEHRVLSLQIRLTYVDRDLAQLKLDADHAEGRCLVDWSVLVELERERHATRDALAAVGAVPW